MTADFAVIHEESIAQRIERTQKKSVELAQQARQSGNVARLSQAASCEMRTEDARRKFILAPAFKEWGNGAFGVNVNSLPLNPNSEVEQNRDALSS